MDRTINILVFSNLDEHHLAQIRGVDARVRVTAVDRVRGAELAPSAEIMLGWNVPPEVLRNAPRLRWIQSTGAGVDRLLVPEVTSSEIILTTSSGIHRSVVEHVFAVMLAFTRRLHLALRDQFQRRWDRSRASGEELLGKTLGILGLGTIGQEIALKARAFGMKIVAMRRTARPLTGVDRIVGSEGLNIVLQESDVVVVALPLTPQTRGLIGADAFRAMKPSAFFINIGRGPIVQEDALVAALRTRQIAGAALDVFEHEPLPAVSPFYEFENVIITPHVSGTSPAYMDRAVALFCENLRRYLRGKRLQNVVDKELGY